MCAVVDLLLCDHLDLLFGQHLSVCIACAIYLTVGDARRSVVLSIRGW